MDTPALNTRDMVLLGAACALGAVIIAIAPGLAFVGLPLYAAGAASFVAHGRLTLAIGAGIIGGAFALLVQPAALVFAVLAIASVLMAIGLIRRGVSFQLVGLGLVGVVALGAFASDLIAATIAHQDLFAQFAKDSALVVTELSKSIQSSGGSVNVPELASIAGSLWPFAYVQLAVLTAVLVIAAIAWAGRRSGQPVDVPEMARVDLNINVIWLPVVSLLLLAIGGLIGGTGLVFRIGLNILLIARLLLLIQGLGVLAALMSRIGIGKFGRMAGYAILVVIDSFAPVVTVVGLIDFWANFRKLPRDGVEAPTTPAHQNEN